LFQCTIHKIVKGILIKGTSARLPPNPFSTHYFKPFSFKLTPTFLPAFFWGLVPIEAKKMAMNKPGGKMRTTAAQGELGAPLSVFNGYNLEALGIPLDARCREHGVYHGKHGYTVVGKNGSVARSDLSSSFYVYVCCLL
jgi:hypothetical protein